MSEDHDERGVTDGDLEQARMPHKGQSAVIAETERLIIRRLVECDVAALASLWTDPQVTRFMGGPRSFEAVACSLKEGLAGSPPDFDLWVVIEKVSGAVIGHCGLLPKEIDGRQQVEIIYLLGRTSWGNGYATEAVTAVRDHAFQTLNLPRLVALIDPDNVASERVALKFGMVLEADTIRPSGKTMRVYSMAAPLNPQHDETK